MSYDVSLLLNGEIAHVARHEEGGTFAVGGTTAADLNITYNYGEVYHLFGFGIDDLHRQRAADVLPKLEELCAKLPDHPYEVDYWAPTPGNAGHALHILLSWAKQHPDAIFEVS